eukprot:TRINITY_DN19363_c0_g1_i1.p2 TRINITY_DN19363_c0_g1~~TRINITY_DN19363_c0_g1_i1.p2  ORF type:complete len:122 (-),score=20.21 TRINITY_DN19363_c0_g1_i1:29-394(-)
MLSMFWVLLNGFLGRLVPWLLRLLLLLGLTHTLADLNTERVCRLLGDCALVIADLLILGNLFGSGRQRLGDLDELLPTRHPYLGCLLYTSDAADEEDSVDLGGRRIIKKKKKRDICVRVVR